ncbi:MAG: methylenetetrahydrofolate--tRNA-(uracil(54)-C(5))-methyltransferase (FADH(2)-oxidizing) TrmFO [Moorellales bacterium]
MRTVRVIGAGLAGCEATWQLAKRGIEVELWEMRPHKLTPAHRTGYLAELVCSNSLRSQNPTTAPGLLKEEMRRLDSIIIRWADATRVPAGEALAVDREAFASGITEELESIPQVRLIREELRELPEGPAIVATGPLTSDDLAKAIGAFFGEDYLYFYDALAPIVSAESLNYDRIFRASRYGKGEEAYLNCPLTEEEYYTFYRALREADIHTGHDFEPLSFFEGCLPIEEMAARGPDTLRFGPMKPVGLIDPHTGKQPFAVVQLRPENRAETMYNLVGFQTRLRWGEQERVFRLIPGLEQAEFLRFGAMHRNTYLNAPKLLLPTFQTRREPTLFFAGQITGVEGYIESAASGLIAGINLARILSGKPPVVFPAQTCLGALSRHITTAVQPFQPMNINFGLLPPLERKPRNRQARRQALAMRALKALEEFKEKELR